MNETKEQEQAAESFGEYLQRERKLRGVTLEEISRATNINMRLLKAVENDKRDAMPADVFVKGLLRSYAKCIGIDSNEVLLAYTEYHGTIENDLSLGKTIDFIEKDKKRTSFILTFAVVGIFVATLLVSFYFKDTAFFVKKKVENAEKSKLNIEESQLSETIKPEKVVDIHEEEAQPVVAPIKPTDISPASIVNQKEPSDTEKVTTLTLKLYSSEDVWIRIEIDEADVKEALMHEGEQIVYKAENSLSLTLGNLKGIIASLNGEDLILPENPKNILRNFKITEELLNKKGE